MHTCIRWPADSAAVANVIATYPTPEKVCGCFCKMRGAEWRLLDGETEIGTTKRTYLYVTVGLVLMILIVAGLIWLHCD
jgi:hypothetical protein